MEPPGPILPPFCPGSERGWGQEEPLQHTKLQETAFQLCPVMNREKEVQIDMHGPGLLNTTGKPSLKAQ